MIGNLRRRITLQQPDRTADGGGGAAIAWSDVATLWAQITPIRGSERQSAEHVQATLRHRIRIRYRADVDPSMRFKADTRLFNIRAVMDEADRHEWLVCLCEEGAPS